MNKKYLMNIKINDLEMKVDFYKTAYEIEKYQHDTTIIDRDFYKSKVEILTEEIKDMNEEINRLKMYLVK